jgi:hypothetical protein
MFRNPLTKRVFVFVYLTFELRYLPLHCLRFPCWSQTTWLFLFSYLHYEFESRTRRGVLDTTLCDKDWQ